MKNKIILSFVLMIPGFCFGLSVKIQTDYVENKGVLIFTALDSSPFTGAIKFDVKNGKIDFSKNKKSYEKMHSYLQERFPKQLAKTLNKHEVSKNSVIPWATLGNIFIVLGIMNDYQVTEHKEQAYDSPGILTELYLYKPGN